MDTEFDDRCWSAEAQGAMIINVPEHKHSITTSDTEPALLAYAWTGNSGDLADQKMEFSRHGGTGHAA